MVYMAANGAGSPVFIDDMTADSSSRINYEVHWDILAAQIRPNAPKLTTKISEELLKAKKWNIPPTTITQLNMHLIC